MSYYVQPCYVSSTITSTSLNLHSALAATMYTSQFKPTSAKSELRAFPHAVGLTSCDRIVVRYISQEHQTHRPHVLRRVAKSARNVLSLYNFIINRHQSFSINFHSKYIL